MQIQFKFLHSVVEPPVGRRKKEKIVLHEAEHMITIREFTHEQVPIAWIETVNNPPFVYPPKESEVKTHRRNWRWFEQTLWLPEVLDEHSVNPLLEAPEEAYSFYVDAEAVKREKSMPGRGNPCQSLTERINLFDVWEAKHILVDGQLHRSTDREPRYYCRWYRDRFEAVAKYGYGQYENKRDYYRIDDTKGLEDSIRDSAEEGSREIEWTATYEIITPEAVQLQPQVDGDIQDEERYQHEYQKFESALRSAFLKTSNQVRALKQKLAELEPSEV